MKTGLLIQPVPAHQKWCSVSTILYIFHSVLTEHREGIRSDDQCVIFDDTPADDNRETEPDQISVHHESNY